MPTELITQWNPKPESLQMVNLCNGIIDRYRAKGFTLTLRQLYYQLVARDLIPNNQQEYKKIGTLVSKGRRAGLIDWSAIEDRTRNMRKQATWSSPASIIDACASQFRLDHWEGQEFRPEVWIEKDALLGVIKPVCDALGLPYFSCRGYTSDSEAYSTAKRYHNQALDGQRPVLIHLGDHDPSGIDMSRDLVDRITLLRNDYESPVDVRRIALNYDQVEEHNPPPNPAKITDSRAKQYIRKHGRSSWELDALNPELISELIYDAVLPLRDHEKYEAILARQQDGRDRLSDIAAQLAEEENGA